MTIGEKIKALRKEYEFSQEELAEKVGYKDKTAISKIEKNEIKVPLSKVERFAKVFGVSPVDLIGWDTSNKDLGTASAYADFELLNKYALLDTQDKIMISKIIEALIHYHS